MTDRLSTSDHRLATGHASGSSFPILALLPVTITPPGWSARFDEETAARRAAAGIDRLVLPISPLSQGDLERWLGQSSTIVSRWAGS